MIESAEKAASAGDFAGAEALLREAAALQSAALGPRHPDLASTFNNLAVACEMTHKPADAELFYRRAYAIAAAALDPTHPLVATSRDNLHDFCQTRGLPIEDPAGAGASQVPDTPAAPQVLARTSAVSPTKAPTQLLTPLVANSTRAFAAAIAVLAVLATLVVAGLWLMPADGDDTARADAPTAAAPDPVEPAPATTSATTATSTLGAATPSSAVPAPDLAPAPTAAFPALTAPQAPAPEASASVALRVVSATVCRTLTTEGAWACDAASPIGAPGRLSYYTRIASSHATRVRHRWYLGDRLRHEATLNVSANPGAGYRTFSRLTVSAGQWRVELVTDDGAVLDQARFEVR